jgi:predicted transcriptional regulator
MTFERLTSTRAKLVYLYLREQGAATDNELREALDILLLTLLPVLQTLQTKALVEHQGGRYFPTDGRPSETIS